MTLSFNQAISLAFCFGFPFLYMRGPPCISYYTKFTIYYALLTLYSTILTPCTIFRPRDTRNLLMTHLPMKFASKLIGLTWTFNDYDKAKELLSSSGPFVIVINHQSSLDVLGLVTQIWPLAEGK